MVKLGKGRKPSKEVNQKRRKEIYEEIKKELENNLVRNEVNVNFYIEHGIPNAKDKQEKEMMKQQKNNTVRSLDAIEASLKLLKKTFIKE